MKCSSLILLFFLTVGVAFSQSDTIYFTYDNYMDIVRKHHPKVKRAELQERQGQAKLLSARGAFDPVIFYNTDQKYFNEEQYYSIINSGLKIPTWVGIDIQAGFENTNGIFLNPEHRTPSSGLVYAGVSIPLGQGLLIDRRRAELKKAEIFEEISIIERDLIINELLFEAGHVYWDWFTSFHEMKVFEEAYTLSNIRFRAVRNSALLGDVPFIDTTEALIQVQNNLLNFQGAKLKYDNSLALLQVYLWDEGIIPLELGDNTIPPDLESVESLNIDPNLLADNINLVQLHPFLMQYRLNIDQLEVDRRLSRELLKPTINLKYNALNEPVSGNPFLDYSHNNYTWGVHLGMPLFLRRERGNLKLINNTIQQSELELKDIRANIEFSVKAALNEWSTTKEQTDLWNTTVSEYLTLLQGEKRLFDNGESSIFMINTRELGYVNAQIRYLHLLNNNRKAALTAAYSLGLLGQ